MVRIKKKNSKKKNTKRQIKYYSKKRTKHKANQRGGLNRQQYIDKQVILLVSSINKQNNKSYFKMLKTLDIMKDKHTLDLYHVSFETDLKTKLKENNYLYYSLLPNMTEGIQSVTTFLSDITRFNTNTNIQFYKITIDLNNINMLLYYGHHSYFPNIDIIKTKYTFEEPKFELNDLSYATFRKTNYEILQKLEKYKNIHGIINISPYTLKLNNFLNYDSNIDYKYSFNECICLNSIIKTQQIDNLMERKYLIMLLQTVNAFIYNNEIFDVSQIDYEETPEPQSFLSTYKNTSIKLTDIMLRQIKIICNKNVYHQIFYDYINSIIIQDYAKICGFLGIFLIQNYLKKTQINIIYENVKKIKLPKGLLLEIQNDNFILSVKKQQSQPNQKLIEYDVYVFKDINEDSVTINGIKKDWHGN